MAETYRNGASVRTGAGDNGNGAPPPHRARWTLPAWRWNLPVWAERILRPRPPGLAVLFARDRFTLVRIEAGGRAEKPKLVHVSDHALPDGTLTPGLSEPNLSAPAELAARLGRAVDALPQGKKPRGACLVLPDACARVILLSLKDLPRSRRQADEVIRWQIRKRVPFKLDEARLSVQRFPTQAGNEQTVVVLALDRVIAQYEQVMESLGLQPGLVDLSTFDLANLCMAARPAGSGGNGDVAVLNVTEEEFSLLVLRHRVPLFYRSKPLIHPSSAQMERSRRELQRELMTSAVYYRERLDENGAGIAQAWLRVARGGDFPLEALAAETLGVAPQRVDPSIALSLPAGAPAEETLERAAPAMGVVLGRWGA